ncbi:MAG: single-stranded DNA-binding protein [Fusobacterium sp.]|nr:single-stranded DNA-binding protein [Fusobacterium sp.]
MNTVVIVGRVGQDAEIKYFESGKSRATFSVAVNRWDAKTKSEIADWYNVDVWDRLAEFAGEYIKKGSMVIVEGSIQNSKWTDKASGEERERFLINASNIRFAGGKREAEAI